MHREERGGEQRQRLRRSSRKGVAPRRPVLLSPTSQIERGDDRSQQPHTRTIAARDRAFHGRSERLGRPNQILYGRRTGTASSRLYGRLTVTRILLLIALSCGSLGLVACGRSSTTTLTDKSSPTLTSKVVAASEWKAVLQDWYDGRISEHHSCGAVVVASAHLPVDGMTFSTINADLARYAAKVCTHDRNLTAIKVGMTDADVAALAGAPQIPASGSCWDYAGKEPASKGTSICFTNGRVTARGSCAVAAPAPGFPTCDLSTLHASVGVQGATGSMLGGLSVRNPGPTCTFAAPPVVEFVWHGRPITPSQSHSIRAPSARSGRYHPNRTLVHGRSLFVWLQWFNYCGPNRGAKAASDQSRSFESGARRAR